MRPPALPALQSNQIDVLSRNSTWTMSRESSLGLMFAGVAYYDGQGFLLRRDAGIDTALQLGGKTVCTQTGTTTELNLSDYFRANDMALKVLALGTAEESRKAYDDRKCDVLTSDVSQLYAERLKLAAPDSHIILPEVISKEPLGPAVRQGDDQWFQPGQVDALFIDQCRGAGRQIGDDRRCGEICPTPISGAWSAPKVNLASNWALRKTGPRAPSARSAITERSMKETLERSPGSASRAD